MAAISNTTQNTILTWLFTSGAVTRPTSWSLSLHTSAPTASAPATGELSGNGYSRQSVTLSVSGQTATNTSTVTFGPATASWGTCTHCAIWDQAGNAIFYGPLSASVTIGNGDSATIAASSLTLTDA